MYSRADVLVLDDVLSAVDASTGRHIIDNCFLSPEMSNRTIIIASHAVESLAPISHQAIFLEDGTSVWQGSGPDLLTSEYMTHLQYREFQDASHDEIASSQQSNDSKEPEPRKKALGESSDFEVRKAPAKTPRQMLRETRRWCRGSSILDRSHQNMWWPAIPHHLCPTYLGIYSRPCC